MCRCDRPQRMKITRGRRARRVTVLPSAALACHSIGSGVASSRVVVKASLPSCR